MLNELAGISEKPVPVIQRAVEGIRRIMDIAEQCILEGKPEEITSRVSARKMPEVEELRRARGEVLYKYSLDALITDHSNYFAHLLLGYREKNNDFSKH